MGSDLQSSLREKIQAQGLEKHVLVKGDFPVITTLAFEDIEDGAL